MTREILTPMKRFALLVSLSVISPLALAVQVTLDSIAANFESLSLAPGVYRATAVAGGITFPPGSGTFTCLSLQSIEGGAIGSDDRSLGTLTMDTSGLQPTTAQTVASCQPEVFAVCPGEIPVFSLPEILIGNGGTLTLDVTLVDGVEPRPCSLSGDFAPVERVGKLWLQPHDFTGLEMSWNVVNAVCPDGDCVGSLPGSSIDLTGYRWASSDEVAELFNSYIGRNELGAGSLNYSEQASAWAPDFYGDFRCDGCFQKSFEIESVASDPPNSDGQVLSPFIHDNNDDEQFDSVAFIIRAPGERLFAGAWFYRQLESVTPPSDLDLTVARASCGPDSAPLVVQDAVQAACSVNSDSVRAFADFPTATVKVFNQAPPAGFTEYTEAAGRITDLITITRGFDENGVAAGTFRVNVDGQVEDSALENQSEVNFLAVVWYPDEDAPLCLDDADDCGLSNGPFDYAEVFFDLFNGSLETDTFSSQGGRAEVIRQDANDLRASLTIPWSVTEENPSFYVGLYGAAGAPPNAPGLANFFDSAKAGLTGPTDFVFSGKNGFAVRTSANAEQPTDPVRLSGNIENIDGRDITALVLASGRFQFSNQPVGRYDLGELPREPDGGVRRQIYASGFVPEIEDVRGSTAEPVVLDSAGDCPNYNQDSMPAARTESAGQRHSLSGRVFVQDTGQPIRAMVLVNGQFDFADPEGNYEVEFPLDSQGQFTRQVYASGFAPSIEKYDASTTSLDIRLAKANECR